MTNQGLIAERNSMSHKFLEITDVTYTLRTPYEVSGDTIVETFQTCRWDFDIELAFSISGKVESTLVRLAAA